MKADCRRPTPRLWAAYREIIPALLRQASEPTWFVATQAARAGSKPMAVAGAPSLPRQRTEPDVGQWIASLQGPNAIDAEDVIALRSRRPHFRDLPLAWMTPTTRPMGCAPTSRCISPTASSWTAHHRVSDAQRPVRLPDEARRVRARLREPARPIRCKVRVRSGFRRSRLAARRRTAAVSTLDHGRRIPGCSATM